MTSWEGKNLSAPFWRLYHNFIDGSQILFNGIKYTLSENSVILIPPNTRYSTSLTGDFGAGSIDNIQGRKIGQGDDLLSIKEMGAVDHLFIHFNLGTAINNIHPGIYLHEMDEELDTLIRKITKEVINDNRKLSLSTSLLVNLLIFHVMKIIPEKNWSPTVSDSRIIASMNYIRENSQTKISNETLATNSNMAINSFARLFKDKSGMTIQQYIQKIRIEKACELMHHTSYTVDEIAHLCGFFDRHHFSKSFKQKLNITPAYYIKNHTMS